MSDVVERFLRYVSVNTQSAVGTGATPSTAGQLMLAAQLGEELEAMGAQEVTVSGRGYVFATIPATEGMENCPVLGFLAHMDTSPALTGANVRPKIFAGYVGNDICLNEEKNIWMRVADFPELTRYQGQDLITTDGTTLLGADDKAGVAEIMTFAACLLDNPQLPHGTIRIGFTPDEEIGCGTDHFDVKAFGADAAYTVDGGPLGELEYENFNAATAIVTISGTGIHPGTAKGRMKNALLMGMEYQSLLPVFDNPMYTEGYEGFYHLDHMEGDVERAVLEYLIRDHDRMKFEDRKEFLLRAGAFLNQKYGAETVDVQIKNSYFNMREIIESHMELIEIASESMEELGIIPAIAPIRGGTDGARLSFMGLPCPNLCTGGHNFHGRYEYICIQSMEQIVKLLINISRRFADQKSDGMPGK